MGLMASYIDQAFFEGWAAPWTTTNPAELDRILERATRDIEAFCGPWERRDDGTLFGDLATNPAALRPAQIIALQNAVAAQAMYRIQNGEDWALGGGDLYQSTSGPDFTAAGRRPRVNPQAKQELAGSGLVIRGARLARR
jgi:hypothetical protein